MDRYCIKDGYKPRRWNRFFDDTANQDEWQREVYEAARTVADQRRFHSVLDIGTGSAYKLLKFFEAENTLGMDLPRTVRWLRRKYPHRKWTDRFAPEPGYELAICADVIEHVRDPDQVLDLIERSRPRVAIISTPDRSLLKRGQDGPPGNKAHVREWTYDEFAAYVGRRFEILDHFISNITQSTQVIVARVA